MATYTDALGNTITPGTTKIAVAVRNGANEAALVVGVCSTVKVDNGQTYVGVAWKASGEKARAVFTLDASGNGQALNAVAAGFS